MFEALFLMLPFKINIPEKFWIYSFKNQTAEADQSVLILSSTPKTHQFCFSSPNTEKQLDSRLWVRQKNQPSSDSFYQLFEIVSKIRRTIRASVIAIAWS